MKFKKDFILGTATSAYQIEGAYDKDGKSLSIWDVFTRIPGKIKDGTNGDIACNHYNNYKEDVAIMKEIGTDSYRFSVAWSRIFPKEGEYNSKGMDFYKKLIKELKENGIEPAITLYHWDLPLWAYEKGGWVSRDSIKWFSDYAKKVFEELGSEVKIWITHNEPLCTSFLGYLIGEHAPGHKNLQEALTVAHHLMLSHGKVVEIFKDMKFKDSKIGITLNLLPAYPEKDTKDDIDAVSRFDGLLNRWFLDPIFKGKYPEDILNIFEEKGIDFSFVKPNDMYEISRKIDFFGINYYNRTTIKFEENGMLNYTSGISGYEKTDIGWEISEEAFGDLIKRIRKEYTKIPIFITENGAAYKDMLSEDGCIHDIKRVEYLKKHLKKITELNKEDMNIKGYYLWSLMDNFEWAHGYSQRFGIVYVDYKNLKKTLKDSAKFYKEIIQRREI